MDLEQFRIENLTSESIQKINKMTIEELEKLQEFDGFFKVARNGNIKGIGTYKSLLSLRKKHGDEYTVFSTFKNNPITKFEVKKEVEFISPENPLILENKISEEKENNLDNLEFENFDSEAKENTALEPKKRGRKPKTT
jgi:hypothetical protein